MARARSRLAVLALAAGGVLWAVVGPGLARAGDRPSTSAAPVASGSVGFDAPVRVRLGGSGQPEERSYRLDLPDDVPGLEISCVVDTAADFDVFVRRGEPAASGEEDADWFGVTIGPEERVRLGGEAGCPKGTYYVGVRAIDPASAATGTLLVRRLDKPPGGATCGDGPPAAIPPGAWTPGHILAKKAAIAWALVEVPEKAKTLDVQVVEATSDVDLVVSSPRTGAVLVRAMTEQVDERLEVPATALADEKGRVWVGVVDRTYGEDEVTYRIAVAFDGPPALPPDLPFPPYPRPADRSPTAAAADAVVEVMGKEGGGSGVCVTPTGLVLTCRHVLEGETPADPLQETGLLIAFPDDVRRPPRQTHRARLLAADADIDLAILRIEGDVYGRPLGPDPRFPWLPLLPPDLPGQDPALGDPVLALGYPEAGSEHARTGIIVTRGIVSGLESGLRDLAWIKTDAWIGPGHSGGPLLDGRLQVVGLIDATLGENRSLGLVRPISRLPEAWRKWIAAERGKGRTTPDHGR